MVGMETKFKRGYENGEKTIEIYDGKVDLVLYNENPNKSSFYFYRFDSTHVFKEEVAKKVQKDKICIVQKVDVEKFLNKNGIDYDTLVQRLLKMAWSTDMNMRDEM
jgi:hypothetical protein